MLAICYVVVNLKLRVESSVLLCFVAISVVFLAETQVTLNPAKSARYPLFMKFFKSLLLLDILVSSSPGDGLLTVRFEDFILDFAWVLPTA